MSERKKTVRFAEPSRKLKAMVKGMTCGSCVSAVTTGLESLEGVQSVAVSLVTEQAAVEYDPSVVKADEIIERIEDCGFDGELIQDEDGEQQKDIRTLKIKIYGMTCSACTNSVESALRGVEGVTSALVALATEEATVSFDGSKVGARDLVEAIEDCGFDAILSKSVDNSSQVEALSRVREIQAHRRDLIKCLMFATPVSILSMMVPNLLPFLAFLQVRLAPGLYLDDVIMFALTIPIQFGVGSRFYKNAWKSISHSSPTMDVLVCMSTSCAFFFSCASVVSAVIGGSKQRPSTLWDTTAMLVTFVMLGKYLENKAKGQTSVALSRLISLVPSTANIYDSDGKTEKTVSTELVQVGDVVILRPGEKVPADGEILTGSSYLSEALITGESFPVNKTVGDSVIGGSVNGPGRIDFKVTKVGSDTKLSHIVRLVQDAQTSRAPVQRYADFLAGYFVPTVIMLGVGTFALWMVVSHVMNNPPMVFNADEGSFMVCLRLCISVIVVACPCALGLATPTAVMVGTGVGAEHGILIKGGAILETANSVDTVMFDKTGTLTNGSMVITKSEVSVGSNVSSNLWWRLVGALESGSEHPIAESIVKKAKRHLYGDDADNNDDKEESKDFGVEIDNFEVKVGNGVCGSVSYDGQTYQLVAGNTELLEMNGISYPDSLDEILTSGETVILVAVDGQFTGWIALSDAVKPEAASAVASLKRLGVNVGMVTGDHINVALKIGKEVGIERDRIWAGVSPSGKIELIEHLQSNEINYHPSVVAMVGDGINDSPALAASSLGIAISGATDVAMEAADIVLLKPDALLDVAAALHLSQAAFYRIKVNLVWALLYNLIMIPFAMGFFLPFGIMLHPMVAGAAMALSSVSVVVSSLLLQRWQPPEYMQRQSIETGSSGYGSWKLFSWIDTLKDKVARRLSKLSGLISRGGDQDGRQYEAVRTYE